MVFAKKVVYIAIYKVLNIYIYNLVGYYFLILIVLANYFLLIEFKEKLHRCRKKVVHVDFFLLKSTNKKKMKSKKKIHFRHTSYLGVLTIKIENASGAYWKIESVANYSL